MISFTFDSTDLSTLDNVTITAVKAYDTPERELRIHKIARADKSILTSAEYSSRPIIVEGVIGADNYLELTQNLNTLNSKIQTQNAQVSYEQAGISLIYEEVTLDSMKTKIRGGSCDFSIVFVASNPIPYESGSNQMLQPQHFTASASSYAINNTGSYTALPVISVTISLLTGGTTKQVVLTNSVLGQGITITRTWTAGDVISIDCMEKTVMVNGTAVDYTGIFPEFAPGSGSIGYTDTLTTRSGKISVTYNRRFI